MAQAEQNHITTALPLMSRCAFFAVAAVVHAASGAAGAMIEDPRDASLLSLCEQAADAELRYSTASRLFGEDETHDEELSRLYGAVHALHDRIFAIDALTAVGIAAKARRLAFYYPGGSDDCLGAPHALFSLSIVRDLVSLTA
jgi:hypothetical protein